MEIVVRGELAWTPHPFNGKRKILLSKEGYDVDITCMLVKIEKGFLNTFMRGRTIFSIHYLEGLKCGWMVLVSLK